MPEENKNNEKHGFAVAALVLGIISIVFCCCSYVGVICGIIGLVLAIVAKKSGNTEGICTAGLVCSIIGVAIFVIWFVLLLISGAAIGSSVSDWDSMMEQINSMK